MGSTGPLLVLGTVGTLFLILAVGFFCRKRGILNDSLCNGLSGLIISVCQPCLMLNAMTGLSYSSERVQSGLRAMALGFGIYAFHALLGFVLTRPLQKGAVSTLIEYSTVFTNCAFIGFPILSVLLGETGLFWGGFYCLAHNVVMWTYGMLILRRGNPEIRMNLRKILVNSGTISALLGLSFFLFRIQLPSALTGALSSLASLCTPISLLVIGASLAAMPPRTLLTDPHIYYCCLLRLVLSPLLVTLLCVLLRFPDDLTVFAAVMASMPTAAIAAMFARKYQIAPQFAAHQVAMSTLLCALTIPLMVWFAEWLCALR